MRKTVTTEMNDKEVVVVVNVIESPVSDPDDCFTPYACRFTFPFTLVNPRVALQVATLLVSDPTVPESHGKEENK